MYKVYKLINTLISFLDYLRIISINAIAQNANINNTLKVNVAMLLIARLMINPIMQMIMHAKQIVSIKSFIMFFFID